MEGGWEKGFCIGYQLAMRLPRFSSQCGPFPHQLVVRQVTFKRPSPKWDQQFTEIDKQEMHECYGRSTVVSDVDGVGVCPECQWWKLARAGLYRSPYNGAMDKHTRVGDEMTGTLQSMPTSEREVQGLYKVCTGRDV
jgi:hypothetical protein